MTEPTVIIDLSPVVRLHQKDDWRHVEMVVKAWREQMDPSAVFYGIADNSLWHHMDDHGRRALSTWKKSGRARSVRWADPEILELATKHTAATVITTDLFRDHRRTFPWLQGTTRMMRPVINGKTVAFEQLDYSPIADHEVSRRVEEADLKPKHIDSPEARQALRFEWACANPNCVWGGAPVIDADPAYANGTACCPVCLDPARKMGACEDTREIVILLEQGEPDRIPIAEGTSLVVGRGRGEARYDVRTVLDESDYALISRNHLRITNASGQLRVEDLGSHNGTSLIREGGGNEFPLHAGELQRLEKSDRLSLARGALQIRMSGRRRARGRYEPDLTTPPSTLDERN
ncbi:FHA domain-containing protein [Mycolicibacterium sp. HK-90]|uniref:FHA domain-containing protein n=1 Tax=Mycolicibacterium sp. HK-90 TaxID=3056937 RepID=UPI002658674C|nr:FHA domain-containing protein [Mycolicibacterium sp. HK-90]WKG04643.1 FHA domain-containing protein [Mycolicibacterium sp. HK-90]